MMNCESLGGGAKGAQAIGLRE